MFHFISSMKMRSIVNFSSKLMVACLVYSLAFGQCSLSYAQARMDLPVPGSMVGVSSAYVPVLLKGMTLHPDDPFRFDFIIDNGNSRLDGQALQKESKKLVNYFLTAMTVPGNDLWVNLSPVEKDRIIPDALNTTELGHGLLAQDYILKQLTASLIYPESDLGRKFWERVYQKAQEKFGTADIPTDTFNKVWIMPEAATVYERGASVYIVDAKLKVMLDSDREAASHQREAAEPFASAKGEVGDPVRDTLTKNILREVILPEIEKEVNSGENFAPLRQIYYSLIFAKWYKEKVRNSILSRVYIDQNKVRGVDVNDPALKEQVYARYMEAYKKGVYNYVKEEVDALTQQVTPRKYFSGGFQDAVVAFTRTDKAQDVKGALVGDSFKLNVKIDAQQDNAEFSKEKKELTEGYSRSFVKYPASLWRSGLRALMMLVVIGFIGMVPVACSKTPTKPDVEIPTDPQEVHTIVYDNLQLLTMGDLYDMQDTAAYHTVISMGSAATDALMAFAQDTDQDDNARRWALYILGLVGTSVEAREFFIRGFNQEISVMQVELINGFAQFVSRNAAYDFCLNFLSNSNYSDHVKAQVMAAVCQIANWYGQTDHRALQMLLQALPVAVGEALWQVIWYMPRVAAGVESALVILNDLEQDAGTRSGAANYLGGVQDPGTLDVRLNALVANLLDVEHNPAEVRQWNASSLGDLGDGRAVTSLQYAEAHDPDESVKLAAHWAIIQINGGGGKMVRPGMVPARYQGKISQAQVAADKAQSKDLGGIDMNDIRIKDRANGPGIEFDAGAMEAIVNMRVDGFAPVIIELTPIKDVLPLLI